MRIEYSYGRVSDSYDTTSTITLTKGGVSQGELTDEMMGGGAGGLMTFGPLLAVYGPAGFMLPLPCFSRFGEAGAQTHFRLVEAR